MGRPHVHPFFLSLCGDRGDDMKIENLNIKFENLVNIKKYLQNTINIEKSKYWTIRQKIKDNYKVINGQCVFKALDAKIKLLESYDEDLCKTLKEIKETKHRIRCFYQNIRAQKRLEHLKKQRELEASLSYSERLELYNQRYATWYYDMLRRRR